MIEPTTIRFRYDGPTADLMRELHMRYDRTRDALLNVRHVDGDEIVIVLVPRRLSVEATVAFRGEADLAAWLRERGIVPIEGGP